MNNYNPIPEERAANVLVEVPYLLKLIGRADLLDETQEAIAQQIKEAEGLAYARGKAEELERIVGWTKEFHENGWDCEELIEHIQEWKK